MTDLPVLPYGGSSGHAGSDTSRERAERDDRDGTTASRQRATLHALAVARGVGLTWRELGDRLHLHHGQASGSLSGLHKAGLIVRLTVRRNRCLVYVLPEYVGERLVSPYGRHTPLSDREQEIIDDLRSVVEQEEGWWIGNDDAEHLLYLLDRLTGGKKEVRVSHSRTV